jgi:hypothetical protein
MPKFDFSKEPASVKLAALALLMTPTILLAFAAVLKALR